MMHIRSLSALIVLVGLSACAPAVAQSSAEPPGGVAPTAVGTATVRGADFGFVFEDMSCYDEMLDTFRGTYTTLVKLPPSDPVTVRMQLSDEQLQVVFDSLITRRFFSFPEVFAVPTPLDGRMLLQMPAPQYRITVRNGGQAKTVEWVDNILSPVDQPAVELRRLIRTIQRLIQAHPSYHLVPPREYACG